MQANNQFSPLSPTRSNFPVPFPCPLWRGFGITRRCQPVCPLNLERTTHSEPTTSFVHFHHKRRRLPRPPHPRRASNTLDLAHRWFCWGQSDVQVTPAGWPTGPPPRLVETLAGMAGWHTSVPLSRPGLRRLRDRELCGVSHRGPVVGSLGPPQGSPFPRGSSQRTDCEAQHVPTFSTCPPRLHSVHTHTTASPAIRFFEVGDTRRVAHLDPHTTGRPPSFHHGPPLLPTIDPNRPIEATCRCGILVRREVAGGASLRTPVGNKTVFILGLLSSGMHVRAAGIPNEAVVGPDCLNCFGRVGFPTKRSVVVVVWWPVPVQSSPATCL